MASGSTTTATNANTHAVTTSDSGDELGTPGASLGWLDCRLVRQVVLVTPILVATRESGDTDDGCNRGCGEGFVPAAKVTLRLRLRLLTAICSLNNTDVGVCIVIRHECCTNKQ